MGNATSNGYNKITGYLFYICAFLCLALCIVAVILKFIPSFSDSQGIKDTASYFVKVVSVAVMGAFLFYAGRIGLRGQYGRNIALLVIVLVLGVAGLISGVLHPEAAKTVGAFAYNIQLISCVPGIIMPILGLVGAARDRARTK